MRSINRFSAVIPVIGIIAVIAFVACGQGSAGQGFPSSPEDTITHVANRMAEGHPEVMWQALPAGYRTDITELTHEFAATMDKDAWDKSFAVVRKATLVLQDKKDLFLGSQMLEMAQDNKDEVAANWNTVTAVLSTFAASEIGDLESLKTVDWEKYISTTGAQLMKIAEAASADTEEDAYQNEFLAKAKGLKVEVIEKDATTATLRITAPDEDPEDLEMTQVEGRWVPTDMAKDWDKNVAEAHTKLAEMTPEKMAQAKMQIMMFVGMAEAFVDQIAQAQTSEELDQMLQGLFGGLMGGGMGGPPTEAMSQ
ncbi:MAG: hypothetical protein K8R59_00320 [Thermoanaerobaculales bacterium]|nr:hypothetical protein [Thermoanaerobaculales bacterium]